MIQQHQRETQSEIKRCDLELRGRHDESVFASDEFLVFTEQHEDYSDAQLEDYREHLQDRHITMMVHRGLASAARARLLMEAEAHELRVLGNA